MQTSGLTEKNMSNKRFEKTEHAIFIAYYKLRDYPTARKLAKVARISHSTFYRHHKKVQAIPLDYEKYLFKKYKKAIAKLLTKDATLKTVFLRTLVFISSNKEVFRALFRENRKEIIKKMLDFLKPKIHDEWQLSYNSEIIGIIYKNEILGVIESWSRHNFTDKKLEPVLNDILYLTKKARHHLLPLE